MSDLPKCPLCGNSARRDKGNPLRVKCASFDSCPIAWRYMDEAEWRRIASPPLPPTVVAVLGTLSAMNDHDPSALAENDETKEEPVFAAFIVSFRAWIA